MQVESPTFGEQTEMNFDALQQIFTNAEVFAGLPHQWESAMRTKVLQQQSKTSGFTITGMDDFDGRLRTQTANGASLPSICIHVATMPAEHSGLFGTQSPAEDYLNVEVTLTRSAFGGCTKWNSR